MQRPHIINSNAPINQAALININSNLNRIDLGSRGALSDDLQLAQSSHAGNNLANNRLVSLSASNTPNIYLHEAVTNELRGDNALNGAVSVITDVHQLENANSVVQSEEPVHNFATQQSKLTLLFQTKALEDKVFF